MNHPEFTFILIISAVIGTVMLTFLLRIYFKTKISEYLIFSIFWFFSIYLGLLIPLHQQFSDELIFWIALETGFIGFFGSLFIHSTRILENSIDLKKIRYFRNAGLVYIAILEILVLFWDLMIQNRAKHLLWIENPHPTFAGKGAGLIINNNVIYSSAHVVPREIFAFVSCITFFWAYWTLKPINPTERVKKAHKLWKLASLSSIIFIISQSLWRFSDFDPQNGTVFATLIGLLAFIIIIYFPEAFILTETQAIRIIELYEVGERISKKNQPNELPEEVYQYLLEVANQLKRN